MNEGDECEEPGCSGILIPADDYYGEDGEADSLPRLVCTECGEEYEA